jgi:hypothetical protein
MSAIIHRNHLRNWANAATKRRTSEDEGCFAPEGSYQPGDCCNSDCWCGQYGIAVRDDVLAAIEADGYVIVPKVATQEMRLAMAKVDGEGIDRYRDMAAAMHAAAPQVPK